MISNKQFQYRHKKCSFLVILATVSLLVDITPVCAKSSPDRGFIQTMDTVLENNVNVDAKSKTSDEFKMQSICIKSGEVLVHNKKRTHVEAPHLSVDIAPDAIVIVCAEGRMTRVLALWENSLSGTTACSGNTKAKITEGKEFAVVFTNDSDEAERIVYETNLRRRALKVLPAKGNDILIEDQFSLLDAVVKDPLLQELVASDKSSDKAMIGAINKAAASLSIAGSKEPYSLHTP